MSTRNLFCVLFVYFVNFRYTNGTMTSKESQQIEFELPLISRKTSNDELKKFSSQHWESDAARQVAGDIVNNVKDLLVGTKTDWEAVLKSIRHQHLNSLKLGVDAIAVNDARAIGALAVYAGWSMHDPAIVYLSAKCLENIASSNKLEDFRIKMRDAAYTYGQNNLPDADLYKETLDFLLAAMHNRGHRTIIKKVVSLLANEDIERALQQSRENLAGRRGGH